MNDEALCIEDMNTWRLNIPVDIGDTQAQEEARLAHEKRTTEMLRKLREDFMGESEQIQYGPSRDPTVLEFDDIRSTFDLGLSGLPAWDEDELSNVTTTPISSQPPTPPPSPATCQSPDTTTCDVVQPTQAPKPAEKRPSVAIRFSAEELNQLLSYGPKITAGNRVSSPKKPKPKAGLRTETVTLDGRTTQVISLPMDTKGHAVFLSADGVLYPLVVDPKSLTQKCVPGSPLSIALSMPVNGSQSVKPLIAGKLVPTSVPPPSSRRNTVRLASIPVNMPSTSSIIKPHFILPPNRSQQSSMANAVAVGKTVRSRPAVSILAPGLVSVSSPKPTADSQQSALYTQASLIHPENRRQPTNFVVREGGRMVSLLARNVAGGASTVTANVGQVRTLPASTPGTSVIRINGVQHHVTMSGTTERKPATVVAPTAAKVVGQVSQQALEAHLKSVTTKMKAEAVRAVLVSQPGPTMVTPVSTAAMANGTSMSVRRTYVPTSKPVVRTNQSIQQATAGSRLLSRPRAGHVHVVKRETIQALGPKTASILKTPVERITPRNKNARIEHGPASLKLGLENGKETVTVMTNTETYKNLEPLMAAASAGVRPEKTESPPLPSVGDIPTPDPSPSPCPTSVASPCSTPACSPNVDNDFDFDPSFSIDALLKEEAIQDLISYNGQGTSDCDLSDFDPSGLDDINCQDLIQDVMNLDAGIFGFGGGSSDALGQTPAPQPTIKQESYESLSFVVDQNGNMEEKTNPTMDIKEFIGSFLKNEEADIDYKDDGNAEACKVDVPQSFSELPEVKIVRKRKFSKGSVVSSKKNRT